MEKNVMHFWNKKKKGCFFMKNESKKNIIKGIIAFFVIVCIVIIGFIIRNISLLNNYDKMIKQYANSNHYHTKVVENKGEFLTISESYAKEGRKVSSIIHIAENDTKKVTYYYGFKEPKIITEYNGEKVLEEKNDQNSSIGVSGMIDVFEKQDKNNFTIALSIRKVQTEECNGKVCYKIDFGKGKMIWLEKETYRPVRKIDATQTGNNSSNHTNVTDYQFEYDQVTEENLKLD